VTLNPNEHILLTDVETTGLNVYDSQLIEVGFMVVDLGLDPIASISRVIIPDQPIRWEDVNVFVRDMHTDNGLRLAIDSGEGVSLDEAERDLVDWYRTCFGSDKLPLCGSSVQFDRKFLDGYMGEVHDGLHYRNQDISSVKELCRLFNPEVYKGLDTAGQNRGIHRVRPDMEDTIEELRFYLDNFLICTRPEL